METLQQILNIYSVIFCLWMCFKWSTKDFTNSMIKVSLFLVGILGIILELKLNRIL